MVDEQVAPIIRLYQLMALDHRSHGTVEYEDLACEYFTQGLDPCCRVQRIIAGRAINHRATVSNSIS